MRDCYSRATKLQRFREVLVLFVPWKFGGKSMRDVRAEGSKLKMEGRIPAYEIARSALGNHDSETDECQSSPRNAPTGFCGVPADSSDFYKLGIRPLDDIEP